MTEGSQTMQRGKKRGYPDTTMTLTPCEEVAYLRHLLSMAIHRRDQATIEISSLTRRIAEVGPQPPQHAIGSMDE